MLFPISADCPKGLYKNSLDIVNAIVIGVCTFMWPFVPTTDELRIVVTDGTAPASNATVSVSFHINARRSLASQFSGRDTWSYARDGLRLDLRCIGPRILEESRDHSQDMFGAGTCISPAHLGYVNGASRSRAAYWPSEFESKHLVERGGGWCACPKSPGELRAHNFICSPHSKES